jgi:putative oxidoreductase
MPPTGPGMPEGLLIPQMNRGVDAMLFCFAFLYIATRGSGIWSLDQLMGKGRKR